MDFVYTILAVPGLWIILQFLSSLAFASMNFIDEWLLANLVVSDVEKDEESDSVGVLVIVSGLFGLVTAIIFGIIAFFSPEGFATLMIGERLVAQASIVGMLEMVWLTLYFYAINRAGAVNAAPLFQAIPVISLLLAVTAHVLYTEFHVLAAAKFAEVPPLVHVVAAGAIICGGFMLNMSEVKGRWHVDTKTIVLMLAASTIIAVIYFLFKDVASESNFVATAFWGGIGSAGASVAIFVFYKPYRRQFLEFCYSTNKRGLMVQLVNEVLNASAVIISQLAMVVGPSVMVVSAMNAWQPIFILIIGWIQAKRGSKTHAEQLQGSKFLIKALSIGVIAGGTVLIAL